MRSVGPDTVSHNEFQRFTKKLKKRILELRKESGYTQEEMEIFELSYRQIQRIEGRETINMRLSTIFKIAKAFKMKPHELLDL
jgi:transcriptional regulator with XRE-family HTH domain